MNTARIAIREAELQRRHFIWYRRLRESRALRLVKAAGYALSFVFCPRDLPEAGVCLRRNDHENSGQKNKY